MAIVALPVFLDVFEVGDSESEVSLPKYNHIPEILSWMSLGGIATVMLQIILGISKCISHLYIIRREKG